MQPGGALFEYLSNACVAARVGNTLFVHGAVDADTMGYVPPASHEPTGIPLRLCILAIPLSPPAKNVENVAQSQPVLVRYVPPASLRFELPASRERPLAADREATVVRCSFFCLFCVLFVWLCVFAACLVLCGFNISVLLFWTPRPGLAGVCSSLPCHVLPKSEVETNGRVEIEIEIEFKWPRSGWLDPRPQHAAAGGAGRLPGTLSAVLPHRPLGTRGGDHGTGKL